MNLTTLRKLIKKGESECLEFKKSTASLRKIGETLCAFLNSGIEGRVFIGVSPAGELVGQDVSDRTFQDIAQLFKHFEPDPNVKIKRLSLRSGKEIVMLSAPPSSDKLPFLFRGRPYQRIGTTTSTMSRDQFRHLLIDSGTVSKWEKLPAEGCSFETLDFDRVREVMNQGIILKRIPSIAINNIPDALEKLELSVEGQLNHASQVLFGTRLTDYSQCYLKLARFRGIDKSDFLDHRQVSGNAFELLEEGEKFLARHISVRGRFVPYKMARIDEPIIPFDALREALVNAICHRDYIYLGSAIDIGIYDDRVEIWSTGTLPAGIQPEQLPRQHRSIRRNPIISKVFYCAGLIEQWGRGTNKIVDLCVQANLEPPRFIADYVDLGVIFPAPIGVTRTDIPPELVRNLSDRKREILRLLKINHRMPLSEIRKHFPSAAKRTLQNDLNQLKKVGCIDTEGQGPTMRWSWIDNRA